MATGKMITTTARLAAQRLRHWWRVYRLCASLGYGSQGLRYPLGLRFAFEWARLLIHKDWQSALPRHRRWMARYYVNHPAFWQHHMLINESGVEVFDVPVQHCVVMAASWVADRQEDGQPFWEWLAKAESKMIIHPNARRTLAEILVGLVGAPPKGTLSGDYEAHASSSVQGNRHTVQQKSQPVENDDQRGNLGAPDGQRRYHLPENSWRKQH